VTDTDIIEKWVSFIKEKKCSKDTILWFAKIKGVGRRSVQDVAHENIKDAILARSLFMGQYRLANGPSLHNSDTAEVKQAFDRNAQIQYRKIYEEFILEINGAKEGLSLDDFNKLLNTVPEVRDRKKLDKDGNEVLHNLDADKNGMIDEDEWVDYCMGNEDDGEGRKVAIKFMKNKEQFEKGRDRLKEGTDDITASVVRILQDDVATQGSQGSWLHCRCAEPQLLGGRLNVGRVSGTVEDAKTK